MIVYVSKSQLAYFRGKARKTKNEIYGMLLGTRKSANSVHVKHIIYPRLAVSDPFTCCPDAESYIVIQSEANRDGLIVLGSIHSHPGAPAYMSPGDLKSHLLEGDIISGIVEIVAGRTRVSFWQHNTPVPAEIEYL